MFTFDEIKMAACILRAQRLSRRPLDSENEIYWHTREACAEYARSVKASWPNVVKLTERGDYKHAEPRVIDEMSEPLWSQVMHPDLLIQDVMDS